MPAKGWIFTFLILSLPIFYLVSPALFLLIAVSLLGYVKWNFAKIKGSVGEWYVEKLLKKLEADGYRMFHDIYVPKEDGTAQVDHVATSTKGIFVIETKHYTGWLFGSEKQRNWTQVIYKRKEKMYNPIWQNYGHIKSLSTYLDREDEEDLFKNIVAFSGQATFKFKEPFTSAHVIYFQDLVKTIRSYQEDQLSKAELREINQALKKLTLIEKQEKRKVAKAHVQAVKQKRDTSTTTVKQTKTKEKPKEKRICPKCKGQLAFKKGRYGGFYGCSNFPTCRHTEKVS